MAACGSLSPARADASRAGSWSVSMLLDYFLPGFDVAAGSFLIATEE